MFMYTCMLHNQRAVVLVQVATTAYKFRDSSKTIPHIVLLHVSYMNDSGVQHLVQYDVEIEQCQPGA